MGPIQEEWMRRLTVLVSVVAMVLIAVPAGADRRQGPVQLALGDSVAAGVGTERPAIHGYVPVLNRWARAFDCRDGRPAACPNLELENLSVPGATSGSLIDNQLGPALGLIGARNGDSDPGNDVEIITVTIGGNDLFNPVVQNCSGGVGPECENAIADVFTSYAANLGRILGSLRSAAPEAEIVMMTYYNPLAACFLAPLEALGNVVLEGGEPLPFGFNDIIREVSAATGVSVADTFGRLDVDDFVGGQDCLHPDKSGHKVIAEVFREVLG